MKSLTSRFLVSLTVATIALGQGNSQNTPANRPTKNADIEWASLTVLATPIRSTPATQGPKSREEFEAAAVQAAGQSKQAGQAAKEFYVSFPTDSRAAQAKKLEAVNLLKGVLATDADRGQAALQVAAAYRADQANPASDRFEVAALAETQRYSVGNGGKKLTDDPAAHEQVADALHTEFGDTPEAIAYFLGVVDSADFETGVRVARKIVQLPAADKIRRQAQTEIDRAGLVGNTLDLTLRAVDGKRVDLRSPGEITVLYVWSESRVPNPWSALVPAKSAVPPNTRWVYLALESTPAKMTTAMARVPFAGTACVEVGGPTSAALRTLKLRRVPFVYVTNAKGVLVGYGTPAHLPALLAAANR